MGSDERVSVAINPEGDELRGSVTTPRGMERRFTGWIALLSALDAAVDEVRQTDADGARGPNETASGA